MGNSLINKKAKTMGTLPVFMTAVSTILGAILFLKFGYSIGHVGLIGTLAIILIGHLVTVPTAMAVAEIATNQKVEGGGAYYIISRSFGLNIGGAIGIALYLAQAISIAFYIIAFTEAMEPVRAWVFDHALADYYVDIKKPTINFVTMAVLSILILVKGANLGVKALYIVVIVLSASLILFFLGGTDYEGGYDITRTIDKPNDFYKVFAIIFPAFTGIAAGLGLSGDLKDPKKSIPRGTLWATAVGIIVYIAVAFKLFSSASPEELAGDPLIMSKIAVWGGIFIPLGLGCAAASSALGSIMIAPRTLQALGSDTVFPGKLNKWISKGRAKDGEPFNGTLVTCSIAFIFVSIGDINVVAEIISMFFMVTYGAICMVSFFEHFAADPSYRPTFKSKWWLSLLGGILCFFLMFKMNSGYAILSILLMVGIYIWISSLDSQKGGLANLFRGVIFQLTRTLQIFLQRRDSGFTEEHWRPFVICVSPDSFKRSGPFSTISWISHKYGFGTYMHHVKGSWTGETKEQANSVKQRLIELAKGVNSRVYLDTVIAPNMRNAMEQVIQLPGVSGTGNNMIMLEYSKSNTENLVEIINNYDVLENTDLDICLLRSSDKGFGYKIAIHIWITTADFENSNLMILIGYIILGHPDWKNAQIKIFSMYEKGNQTVEEERLLNLIKSGRLPISPNNIQLILQETEDFKNIINSNSIDADLTLIGFNDHDLKAEGTNVFEGYEDLGNILFINAKDEKKIDVF